MKQDNTFITTIMLKRAGVLAWIARLFYLSYGWIEVTYKQILDKHFNYKEN